MKKQITNKPVLTLHSLLGAISYWGTATRGLLFGFIALIIFLVALTETNTSSTVDNQILILIYVLGSFLLLDFGYVMIARTYPFQKAIDVLLLSLADVFLAMVYIIPKIVVSNSSVSGLDPLTFAFFIPIVVLGIRVLLGILFSSSK